MKKASYKRLVGYYGWYGVIAIIVAYGLLNFNILDSRSMIYQVLNLTGSIGVLLEAWQRKDYQPIWINAFWSIIALIAILRALL